MATTIDKQQHFEYSKLAFITSSWAKRLVFTDTINCQLQCISISIGSIYAYAEKP